MHFLYYHGFIQFISLVTPPLTFDLVYQLSNLSVFFIHYSSASFFVYLYVLYEHTFHFDAAKNIPTSRMRWICFVLKFLLTIISVFVSIAIPLETQPVAFLMLTKVKKYDRYVSVFHIYLYPALSDFPQLVVYTKKKKFAFFERVSLDGIRTNNLLFWSLNTLPTEHDMQVDDLWFIFPI